MGNHAGTTQTCKPAHPPVGTPSVGTPSVGTPPVGTPPVGTPPVGTPPVGTPPVGTPSVGTPPVGTPPVGTPPVGTPPVGTIPQTALPLLSTSSKLVTPGPPRPMTPRWRSNRGCRTAGCWNVATVGLVVVVGEERRERGGKGGIYRLGGAG
ncbi:hypothetical protein BZA77DRAFT_358445 [Pyronema omphalodes]|nr:hypothetical protein BZA77DRAFT_358445 [Pyronema omphalodes]